MEYKDSLGNPHQLWPVRDRFLPVGENTVAWDGRDEAGNIVTDISEINYMIGGFVPGCDPCSVDDRTSFHHIKSNHIQVVGPSPEIPLTSIKSDPYVMHLSYGEVVTLYYSLAYDAHVTVTVVAPSGSSQKSLLVAEPQSAGEHEVAWDGTADSGRLFAEEGHYTFTVTATNPLNGESVSRKGNINVRR